MKIIISNQNGIAAIPLILIITALAAIAGGGWYFGLRDSGDTETSDSSRATSETEASSNELAFSGSYFDAIGRGQPLQCEWRAPEDSIGQMQAGQGKLYTDGETQGRSDATFVINDNPAPSHAIIKQDTIYQWTEVAGATVGLKISKSAAEASEESLSDEQRRQGAEFAAKYTFDCQPWTVDQSKFNLPAGIEFIEPPAAP